MNENVEKLKKHQKTEDLLSKEASKTHRVSAVAKRYTISAFKNMYTSDTVRVIDKIRSYVIIKHNRTARQSDDHNQENAFSLATFLADVH